MRNKAPFSGNKFHNLLIDHQLPWSVPSVAAVCGGESISYGELEACSNRLARFLQKQGVGPDRFVAICMERGLPMLISMIGILKAGGAYLPLNTGYPAERLRFMLRDSAAQFLLTQESLVEAIPAGNARVFTFESLALEEQSAEPCGSAADPDSLMYLLYTSGSTGNPKGVEVTRAGVSNVLAWAGRTLGFSSRDVMPALSTLSFDIATLELLLPLCYGGRVVIVDSRSARDPRRLGDTFAAARPTVIQATPATWSMLVDAGWQGDAELQIISGGDVLSPALASALQRRCRRLWNWYGPTEASIYSHGCLVEDTDGPIPIGRPVDNTRSYILDEDGAAVAPGAIGEICLSGVGVARGYLNEPQLTAERFYADPFNPGQRMYRSGDLGRCRADGQVEFLGRADLQLKIRGFRIEPGEVEAALKQHPGVRDAVVVARPGAGGSPTLTACLVAGDQPLSASELRGFLAARLPTHAIPSWYEELPSFPLTPSNKVDRRALSQGAAGSRRPVEERQRSITAAEADLILNRWNDTGAPLPAASVDLLFERHAARQPEHPAILWANERISYSALNEQANGLARRLGSAGAGRGSRIALLLKHSPAYLRAVLGVLKTGGVYVPIPADYPAERIAFMLEDSGAEFVLTEREWLDKLPRTRSSTLLVGDWTASAGTQEKNPAREVSLDDPALILYTSGSSGKPKGVLLPHRSILRLASNANFLAPSAEDVVSHFSNIGFAIAIFEVWIALASGATLAILPQETAVRPLECRRAYERYGVSLAFLTTSLFNLAAQECPDMFGGVRCVCFGGEKADPDAVSRVLQRGKPERLINVYGCTETSSIVSFYDIPAGLAPTPHVPIGRPASNAVIYIVDDSLRLVPIGMTGEIVVGGPCLADGYVNRTELTADRFVPDPFGQSGARLYRTGDRGFFLPNGNLVCLGRADSQVTIHGYRVELGEIEAALLSVPGVRHGAVVLQSGGRGRDVVAFWVPQPGHEDADPKPALRRTLPDYMIPGSVVRLASLPLNPNGKIDRPALAAYPVRQERRQARAPRTPLETRITALFQEVLEAPGVGMDESFFELGGDSVSAIRLITRIERDFGVALSVEAVLDNDTPAALLSILNL